MLRPGRPISRHGNAELGGCRHERRTGGFAERDGRGKCHAVEVDGDYFPRRLDDPVLVSLTVVGEDRRALVQAAAGSAGRVVVTAGERSAGSGGQFSGVWHAAVVASERPDGTVVITTAGNDRLEEVVAAGQTLWLGESEPIPGAEPPAYREEMRPDGSSFIAGSPPTHKTRWRAAGLVGERVETSPADGAIAIARAWRSPYDRREGPYNLPDAGLRNTRPHSWKQAWLRDEHSVVVHLVGGDGEAVHSAQVEGSARSGCDHRAGRRQP